MTSGSATAIAAAVRTGEATATRTVTEALARIDDDPLNAFTELDGEGAQARARKIDDIVSSGGDPGPLAGVPIALKDLIDHAGHVTTAGSSFYRHSPKESAPVVARLEDAGAVIVGRTGLHEFAFGFSSENAHFGPVLNPWDRSTSPGGSSGGSAAAVGAGWLPLGIGTDTGGSVRVPAALCGAVGLKVTHGAIPLTGVFPLAPSLDTIGPIARTIEDSLLAYRVMAGADTRDPWSRPTEDHGRPMRRVGVPSAWIEAAPLASDVADAFDAALAAIERSGVEVAAIDEPSLVPSSMIDAMAYGEVAPIHRQWWREQPEQYGDEIAERLEIVYSTTLDEHVASRAWRSGLQAALARVFEDVDVIVTPAACVTSKTIGEVTVPTRAGETNYRRALAWFTALVNHMSAPALVVPLATDGAPPPALQMIGPWWSESQLGEFAGRLELAGILGATEPAP